MIKKETTGQGGLRYPWIKWLNKNRVTLRQGKHFDCLPHSFAQQMRNAAYRYRYKVSITVGEDFVVASCVKED